MNNIITTSWLEEKKTIEKVNPRLYQIISDNKSLIPSSLVKLKYSYGELVGDGWSFKYPSLIKSLERTPFSLIIKNNFEMYLENSRWLSPWKIYKPGDCFPYTRFIKKQNSYQPSGLLELRAGSRASFLLMNKEFDRRKYSALYKSLNINEFTTPEKIRDQFYVFKDITNTLGSEWKGEIIIFPESWEEKAKDDVQFIAYMEEIPIETHSYNTNIPLYNYIINLMQYGGKITSNYFSREIINHLFTLINGSKPGYTPVSDESYAPISLIKETLLEYYKPESSPIFMVADKLVPLESNFSLYYSLNIDDYLVRPTTLPNIGKLTKETLESFIEYCNRIVSTGGAENTIFYKTAKTTKVRASLKRNNKNENYIMSPKDILKSDVNFVEQTNETPNLPIPENASFLSACFKIQYI